MFSLRSSADLILLNGKILTMDDKNSTAEAVAVKEDRICKVGSSAEVTKLADAETFKINLRGRTVMPGFIDAHTHMDLVGMMTSDAVVNCRIPPLNSVEQMLANIKKKAASVPKGELIIAQRRWTQPAPTRQQLDEAAPHHPVILRNTMHYMLLNSRALAHFGITSDKPTARDLIDMGIHAKVYRDADTGEPTGEVDDIWNYLFPKSQSPFQYGQTEECILNGLNTFVSLGVTTITELYNFPESAQIYQELRLKNALPARIQLVPCVFGLHQSVDLESVFDFGLMTGFGDDWIKFAGIKLFLETRRDTTISSLELKEIVQRAHASGIRVFMHAVSRKAQDMALEAIEFAVESMPQRELRHRIEHMGVFLWDLGYFDRLKKVGAIGVPTAYFTNIGLNPPEGIKQNVYRTMLDKGLCVPGNSDSGGAEIEGPNPFYQIWCMVERRSNDGSVKNPEEKVSVMEGLQMYTRHSAYAVCDENIKGSIEPGKLSDMIILNKDPLSVSHDDLLEIQVDATIVGGGIVYQRKDEI